MLQEISASSRISKGQGYQGLILKEKGREQFWPKKGNLCCTRKNFKNEKNGQNFTPFRVNKMISNKLLIFLQRKVPGQTGARTRDLWQHCLALPTL
jgi:hypothetical protein